MFLVVNAALGAGLLNFPKAYDQSGGIVVAVIVQAVSHVIIRLLLMLVRDSTEIWLFDVPAQYLEEEAFK